MYVWMMIGVSVVNVCATALNIYSARRNMKAWDGFHRREDFKMRLWADRPWGETMYSSATIDATGEEL